MKSYQWRSIVLKRKSNKLSWIALVVMLLALGCFQFLPAYALEVAVGLLGVAVVFMMLAWKAQSDDKKLKKR